MRTKIVIIAATAIWQVARAQDSASLTIAPITVTAAVVSSPTVANSVASTNPAIGTTSAEYREISIMDYKNVYEAASLEEEVQMATERFNLTKVQQEVWATAAVNRRHVEKQTRTKLESKEDYSKLDVYKGLKSANTEFYETIIGYLDANQKQALERDRVILEEKRKMIAKLPPPVIAPTVTVAPVDSAAIYESEKIKKAKQRSKKKKKTIGT